MEQWILTIFSVLSELGYLGIVIGLMIEVIPSELVLSYGGYLISKGEIHFVGALISGVIGGTIAQVFLYWIGAYGGRPFLQKYGKFLFISEKHLTASENWFEKYGTGVIFSARFIPIIRHAISIPAGIAKMPLSHFTLLTIGAMIPWTVLFLLLGMELGEHWQSIRSYAEPFIIPIISIALGAIIVYFLCQIVKEKRKN